MEPYQPILHTFPEDTLGRFQVLREFLRRWHNIDTGSAGRTVPRIEESEGSIRHDLPLGIREWIVFLDDLERVCKWRNVLRDCWSLKKVPNCDAFSLLVAGENDRHWGVLVRDLGEEDPPTYAFVPDYKRDESRFIRGRKEAPRVSTWAVEFILTYLYLSRSLQCEADVPGEVFKKAYKTRSDKLIASKIGKTSILEFTGGLVLAEKQGKDRYRLRAYAPNLSESHDRYYTDLMAFSRRLRDELELPFR